MSTTDLYKFRTACNMRGCHAFHVFLIKSSKIDLPIYWRWRGCLGTIVRKILLYLILYIFLRSQNICHDATRPMHLQNSGHLSNSTGSLSLSYGFSTHEFTSFSGASSCPSTYKIFQGTKMGYVRKKIFITSFPLTSYTIVISHCSLSCPRLLSSNKKSQSVMNCNWIAIVQALEKTIPLYTVVGEAQN